MLPILGKPLVLYILAISSSLVALLAQHDENEKELSIYYININCLTYEVNYKNIEKAYLVVVFASQSL